MAAEHNFLEWLDKRFSKMVNGEKWSAWLQLLRLVRNPRAQEADQANSSANNLIDVEIFDDTQPNIFDESIYTEYKCFQFMLKNMNNCPSLDADSKERILSEYSNLKNL